MQKVLLRTIVNSTIAALLTLSIPTSNAQTRIVYGPPLISGLNQPMEVVSAPGDNTRLFIVEKAGRIRIWNGSAVLATSFLDINTLVEDDGEQGLLSMAFHPQYASNGFFFVYYNNNAGNIIVARYQVSSDPNVATPTANPLTPLINIPKPFDNHNGGHLQFKVEGGIPWLYFATGDGGSGNDPNNNAQNYNSRLGKMLRINVDLPSPPIQVWAWGLRNPFRWSFDRATGDIWIGDVGQGLKEEIDFRAGGTIGANYGWACMEGTVTNTSGPGSATCDSVGLVDVLPVFEYNNPNPGSSSVVGGYVYRGTEFPTLIGTYITTDFYSGQVWQIRPNGSGGWTTTTQPNNLATNIASISETNDGANLYAVSLAGTVSRVLAVVLVPTPVTLVAFSGRNSGNYNDLKWETTLEENLSSFIIEFSTDGRNYQRAGTQQAFNDPNGHSYNFRHQLTVAGKIYYRLRIIENNAADQFSPVIAIGGIKEREIKVYPTITRGPVNIISPDPIQRIELYNSDGKLVMQKRYNNQEGYFNLQLPALRKGMYYLKFFSGGEVKMSKVILE